MLPGFCQRPVPGAHAGAHQRHVQHPLVAGPTAAVRDARADADDIRGRGSALVASGRALATAPGLLPDGGLLHGDAIPFHDLVNEPRGRCSGAGDQGRSDAVGIHRSAGQRGDRVLVEIAGDHDPG